MTVNVIGHGIDIVDLPSFQKLLDLSENNFTTRVFTQEELDLLPEGQNRIQKMAGRFATKEAVMKAVGTGFGNGIAFTDITVIRKNGAKPEVILKGKIAKIADELQITNWHVSISHTEETVISSVIAC